MIRARTAIVCVVVVALAAAAWLAPRSHGVHAQTADQLPALALSTDDLPGYSVSSENATPQANGTPAFARVLTSANGSAVVSITLVLTTDSASLAATRAAITDGSLLAAQFGAQTAFQANQPQGIGEADSSASWQSIAADGTVDQVYAEAFLRGPIAAIVIDSATPDTADPTAAATLAQQQDAKLQSAIAAATASPSPTAALATSPSPTAAVSPSPMPAATSAPSASPRLAAATPQTSLSTAQGLQKVALQQSDIPAFVSLDAEALKNPPAQVLADYLEVWAAGNPNSLQVTLITEELTSLASLNDAEAFLPTSFQLVTTDSSFTLVSRLPSSGVGDEDYGLTFQSTSKRTGNVFQTFEEVARVGNVVIDVQVGNSSNQVTLADAVRYARIIAARVAAAH